MSSNLYSNHKKLTISQAEIQFPTFADLNPDYYYSDAFYPYHLAFNSWYCGKAVAIFQSNRKFYLRAFGWVPIWNPEPLKTFSYSEWYTLCIVDEIQTAIDYYKEYCKELLRFKSPRDVSEVSNGL